MADIELRFIGEIERPAFLRTMALGFGSTMTDDDMKVSTRPLRIARSLAALDGDEIVGTAVVYPMQMNIPEGRSAATAVVSGVTVLPTHRRQGILTRMMDTHLREAHDNGETFAMLGASESIIYGRYGYGIASIIERWSIDRRHTELAYAPESPGRLRFIDRDDAMELLPSVAVRVCADRPAFVALHPDHWSEFLADFEHERRGGSAFHFVVYEEGGQIDGYVIYRLRGDTVSVVDLMAGSDEAHTALWRFCFGIDLRTTIECDDRPVDDPLPWMLADPRRLQRTLRDGMWLRILDVQKALEARTYAREGRILLEVRDDFCPWNEGRYELEGGSEGAHCVPTTAEPDITLSAADLAAAYLDGVSFSTLEHASRAEVASPEAAQLADAMFRTRRKPWWAHQL